MGIFLLLMEAARSIGRATDRLVVGGDGGGREVGGSKRLAPGPPTVAVEPEQTQKFCVKEKKNNNFSNR